ACFDMNSNAEQRDCLSKLHRDATAELAEVYHRALERAAAANARMPPGDKPGAISMADAITASQTAWEAHPNAECWGVPGTGNGPGRMTWVFGCAAERTFKRIQELKVPYVQR